ncbi:hypothetical protein GCM10011583_11440 [Streptomyces camponoticapitis]|uniref:Uncharacterized protein n=1 Tax=Streptomyces camponoticapitis TaxID=1616125 RepID=A0ABQ2E365_9ACTN|nr:hypothetical protein [Streptomyces camponoticapitis]GGJ81676.1 hypothetical protein GCM10011583_11440 [Streptomyces camponoticapitis]
MSTAMPPEQDEIRVRISLDHYDLAHPGDRQTQVYVTVPDVVRVSYMLPAHFYETMRDQAWGEVLDQAHGYYTSAVWADTDAASKAKLREWLGVDEHRDQLADAHRQDHIRRDPIARGLQTEVAVLKATVAELEAQRERRRGRLVALQNDATNMRGALSPNGQPRRVPMELGETLTPAVEWLIARVAELETAAGVENDTREGESTPLIVYRAVYEPPGQPIPLGWYTTTEAARAHCETALRFDNPAHVTLDLDWIGDESEPLDPWELVAAVDGSDEQPTGYVVTPIEVASTYDPDADEMTTADLFTGDELREMDQADEARFDAEDDARNAAEAGEDE